MFYLSISLEDTFSDICEEATYKPLSASEFQAELDVQSSRVFVPPVNSLFRKLTGKSFKDYTAASRESSSDVRAYGASHRAGTANDCDLSACHRDKSPPVIKEPPVLKEEYRRPYGKPKMRLARVRPEITHFEGGSKASIKPMKVCVPPENAGGVRKQIGSMSAKSMRNLKRKCAEVKQDAKAWTFALTYGQEFPTADVSKDEFQRLQRWINKTYPEVGGFWKREPQKRGATHYHFLVFIEDDDEAKLIITDICYKWCEIANEIYGEDQHRKSLGVHLHATNCEQMRGKSFFSYLAKYLAKTSEGMPEGYILEKGRGWWGKVNVDAIPWAEKKVREIGMKEVSVLKAKQLERSAYNYRQSVANKSAERATSELSRDGRLVHSFDFHTQMLGRILKSLNLSPVELRKRQRFLIDPEKKFRKAKKLRREGEVTILTIHIAGVVAAWDRFLTDERDLDSRSRIFGDNWTPPVSAFPAEECEKLKAAA